MHLRLAIHHLISPPSLSASLRRSPAPIYPSIPQNKPSGVRGRNFSAAQYEELVRLLDLMRAVGAEEGDHTPAQIAINWLLCKGVLPIPGAKNAAQVRQGCVVLCGRGCWECARGRDVAWKLHRFQCIVVPCCAWFSVILRCLLRCSPGLR